MFHTTQKTAGESASFPVPSLKEESCALSHGLGSLLAKAEGFVSISVVSNLDEANGLEGDWNRLLSPAVSPFSTFDWVMAWFESYSDECEEILIFVGSRQGEVVAILPCYRKGRKIRLAGDITCDYQDVISANLRDAMGALAGVYRWLLDHRNHCELFFQKVSNRGWIGRAEEVWEPDARPSLVFRKSFVPCPCVQLPGSLDEYLRALPRKPRSEFRRVVNRLNREVPGAVIEILDKETIAGANLVKAADFHVKHFRKKGRSPLADPRLVSLLERVCSSDEVGLKVSWLREGESLMAVDFAFCRGGTFYGYLTDFDETYARLSPGRCLFIKRIDHWIQHEGITRIDLLGGGEKYKKSYTEGDVYRVSSIRFMPASAANWIRWSGLHLDRRLRAIAKSLIDRWNRLGAAPG